MSATRVTLLIHHRVADYDAWRPYYDRVLAGPMGSADWSLNYPDLPAVLVESGVDLDSVRIDYLSDVG